MKYAAWKANAADMQAIQEVVDGIAQENISALDKKEQLAFYINAYNAWILHEALGKYPTKSVKDALFTFFTGKRITVAGEQMSFNALEKDIIRPKFGDPRIHFALNCASRSCPPLNPERVQRRQARWAVRETGEGFVNSDQGREIQAGERKPPSSPRFSIGTRTTSKRRAARSPSSTSAAPRLCRTTRRSVTRTTIGP